MVRCNPEIVVREWSTYICGGSVVPGPINPSKYMASSKFTKLCSSSAFWTNYKKLHESNKVYWKQMETMLQTHQRCIHFRWASKSMLKMQLPEFLHSLTSSSSLCVLLRVFRDCDSNGAASSMQGTFREVLAILWNKMKNNDIHHVLVIDGERNSISLRSPPPPKCKESCSYAVFWFHIANIIFLRK